MNGVCAKVDGARPKGRAGADRSGGQPSQEQNTGPAQHSTATNTVTRPGAVVTNAAGNQRYCRRSATRNIQSQLRSVRNKAYIMHEGGTMFAVRRVHLQLTVRLRDNQSF